MEEVIEEINYSKLSYNIWSSILGDKYTDTDSIINAKKISNQNIILENMMIGDETIENYEEKYGKNSMEYIRIKKIEEEIKNKYYLDINEDEYLDLLKCEYIDEYSERIRKMFYYWEFEKI